MKSPAVVRTKSKKSKNVSAAANADVTKAPATSPCLGELTVDERDAIDAAKQRAKDMLTLVMPR